MWQNALLAAVVVLGTWQTAPAQQDPLHGLQLLPGYKHKPLPVDPGGSERSGVVEKPGGLKIFYRRIDPGATLPADTLGPADWFNLARHVPAHVALWYRKHTAAGQEVYVAYRRDRMLVVSYPRNRMNFLVRVKNAEEMAEALLLLLSYRPTGKR